MSRRPLRPFSWFWCAGFLLLDQAHALVDLGVDDDTLHRQFMAQCGALPERDQRLIHDLPLTEVAVSTLSNDQRAIMTTVFRRLLSALTRDQRRQPVSMNRGGDSI